MVDQALKKAISTICCWCELRYCHSKGVIRPGPAFSEPRIRRMKSWKWRKPAAELKVSRWTFPYFPLSVSWIAGSWEKMGSY